MAILLGVVVAASFGTGDFLGGLASRRAGVLHVVALVQLCALVASVGYALGLGGHATARDAWLGAGAGALNVVGLGLLFAGLATGRMGIVAPVTAVVAAVIPVVWGLGNGEDLTALSLTGVIVAIVAAALIGRERDADDHTGTGRALLLAVAAGVLFGWSFVLYAETGHDSGAWPVLTGRVAAVSVVLAVVALRRGDRLLRVPPRERTMAFASGFLDVSATALLLIAVRHGFIAEVAPLAALGPAFTVLWARFVLHEHVSRVQLVGLAAALAGLAMIAAG